MTVRHQLSPSSLVEPLLYYIVREPGNTLVPLVPIDQLPYQLKGVPRQLSPRQMAEEKWKFVDDTSEPAVILPMEKSTLTPIPTMPPSPVSPVSPRFLAPDYHANKDTDSSDKTESQIRTDPPTRFEHHQVRRDVDRSKEAESSTGTCLPTSAEDYHHAKRDVGVDSKDRSLAGYTCSSPSIKPHQLVEADADTDSKSDLHNDYARALLAMEQQPSSTVVFDNKHQTKQGVVYTRFSSIKKPNDVMPENADNGIKSELRPSYTSLVSPGIEYNRGMREVSNGNRMKARINPLSAPPDMERDLFRKQKVYCNHWIQHGECSWGSRCIYKHEMPPIDILRVVTGFNRVPRWYKEKMAIQSLGPSWMERRLQQEQQDKDGVGIQGTEMPAARMFPDPSKLKSLWREKPDVAEEDVPAPSNVCAPEPTLITGNLIDFDAPESTSIPQAALKSATLGSAVVQTPSLNSSPALPTMSPQAAPAVSAPAPAPSPTQKKKTALATLRRLSQISGSSDNDATKLAKSKCKAQPKKGRHSGPHPKKAGLSSSKYAPTENERRRCKMPDIYKPPISLHNMKGNAGGRTSAPTVANTGTLTTA